jgi:hypothetical protein
VCGTIFVALALISLTAIMIEHRQHEAQLKRDTYVPPVSWLTERADPNSYKTWDGMVPAEPGDEIWLFRSPKSSWKEGGAAGVCLVRGGQPIDGLVTESN